MITDRERQDARDLLGQLMTAQADISDIEKRLSRIKDKVYDLWRKTDDALECVGG